MGASSRAQDRPPLRGRIDEGAFGLRVRSIVVDELRFPIEPPLTLAGRLVRTREYAVVQVTLADGTTGTSYVLTRGRPIAAEAVALAHRVVGAPLESMFAREDWAGGHAPDQRAAAVLDHCAWDLLGQAHQLPIWQLFGDARPSLPVLLVAGYRRAGEDDRAMARRLADRVSEGFDLIKIAADPQPDATTRLLSAIREVVGPEDLDLVLDLGFAGPDRAQMLDAVRDWKPFGVRWVEDPWPVTATADIAALRAAGAVPVAVGDEASPAELRGLLDHAAVDVLRADATTVGGLSGLHRILSDAPVPVSTHVYPETHRHLAFTAGDESPLEMFPSRDPFDFADRFVDTDDLTPVDGRLGAPRTPGLGLRYRAESVTRYRVRSTTVEAS
ncbi:enolase C-terminal domain-like protein [Streptomyces rhizosphaericus]|uniref:Mandelate racemase/muconate lactonizing enzyme C-terminal domain-containing protein n=1 Tax=Streptomyces rhizosphaericus TaxID=114699 RepID=A0A6G4ASM1_9ACTN|nr:enolase C-terminal domain-like protein [Streptomyces rhizosphaericus]NEW76476.1 hypothetical protein [Streptomyces rhizosphaericus]